MRSLIIYVNGSWLRSVGSGISQHVEVFIRYFPEAIFCVLTKDSFHGERTEYEIKYGRGLSDFVYEHNFLEKPDYYLAPANIGPLSISKLNKTILVVHDLISVELNPISSIKSIDSLKSYLMNVLRSLWIKRSIKYAAFVLAPTLEMSNKISKKYGRSVIVAKNYLDASFFDTLVPQKDRGKYILSVTSGNHSKNARSLLLAFAFLMQFRSDLSDYKLVLIGKGLKSLKEYRNNIFKEKIVIYENIDHEELLDKYRYAAVYVHPSFEEGFGRPVYEALACGTIVAVAKYLTLQKIHFNERIPSFDATDIEEMANCIIKAITNPVSVEAQQELQLLAHDYHMVNAKFEIAKIKSSIVT